MATLIESSIRELNKVVDGPINGSSLTEYTTKETVVGTWVQGETVYQRSFIGTVERGGRNTIGKIEDVGAIIECSGSINAKVPEFYNGEITRYNNTVIPLPCGGVTGDGFQITAEEDGDIILNISEELREIAKGRPYYITLRYIKYSHGPENDKPIPMT